MGEKGERREGSEKGEKKERREGGEIWERRDRREGVGERGENG